MEPTQSHSDADRGLIEGFLRDRAEARFLELYRRHTPSLWSVGLRLVGGNEEEAAEVVQITWVRAIERLARFEGRSAFRTWLTGILINACRERWRSRERSAVASLHVVEGRSAPAGGDAALRIDLERAVCELPDGCREVLVLHDIEGFTHEQIAERLEIHVGTSKSQLARARTKLRETLRRRGGDPYERGA